MSVVLLEPAYTGFENAPHLHGNEVCSSQWKHRRDRIYHIIFLRNKRKFVFETVERFFEAVRHST